MCALCPRQARPPIGGRCAMRHGLDLTAPDVTVTAEAESAGRFHLIHAADLKARAPEWIIRGRVEANSLAMIFGDPACGKSFLAVDWACSVATGKDYHGHTVQQAPVIFIAGEGLNGIARRLQIGRAHV